MNRVVVVEQEADPALRSLVIRAAERASVEVVVPQVPPAVAVGAVVGFLPRGRRRLDPVLADLAETLHPTLPVIVLCEDPLPTPVVRLAGGRLILIGHPADQDQVASLLATCRPVVERQDRPKARAVAAGGGRICAVQGGLAVAWADDPGLQGWIQGDVLTRVSACIDAERTQRVFAAVRAPTAAAWACGWLADDAGTWLVVGSAGSIVLDAPMRLPARWSPTGLGMIVRWLEALPGDRLVLGPAADDVVVDGARMEAIP